MSSGSVRLALLMSVFAFTPADAQPAVEATALMQDAAPAPSNSTLDVPIEDIVAVLGGCAVLDKDFPGLRSHAMFGFIKTMTLNQIAAMSHGKITPFMLAQAQTDLSALPFKPVARRAHQTDVEDLDLAPSGSQASLDASYQK